MPEDRPRRPIPIRAGLLSTAALMVPVVGQVAFSENLDEYQVLLWLTALIPAFLFAYYRGWRGVAGALAVGMAALAVTQVVLQLAGRQISSWPWLVGVVTLYIGISMAVGWVTELLHRERERAESLAMIDVLTDLPNRRLGQRFLEMEVAAAQRGRPVTIVIFDLDDFKAYNDTHGHNAGDEAIAAMGRALRQNTRKMELSVRWGGEEFVSILTNTDPQGGLIFVERVRETLQAQPLSKGRVTFSAGVAEYGAGIASSEELLEAADRALYLAKAAGRSCARIHERSAYDRSIEERIAEDRG